MNIEHVFSHLPTLKTNRLILRKMKLSDAQDIFDYASDHEVSKTTNWSAHNVLEDSKTYLKSMLKRYSYNQASEWGIVHKKSGKMIGTCGFTAWIPGYYKGEIGYSLAQKFWNLGLTTEAIRKVIEFGFTKIKLNRIEARCWLNNPASERVMQKVGMQFEGSLRETMFVKKRFRTLKLYSILASDYNNLE
ncbi:MAG: GNAT family N-acetyltransferase [Planctomycetes bacterium]|nr:GNAT family N-acetyltransferase [Planctomycetota bacterium]